MWGQNSTETLNIFFRVILESWDYRPMMAWCGLRPQSTIMSKVSFAYLSFIFAGTSLMMLLLTWSFYTHRVPCLTGISLVMFVWVNSPQACPILHFCVHRSKHGPKIRAVSVAFPFLFPDLSDFIRMAVSNQ